MCPSLVTVMLLNFSSTVKWQALSWGQCGKPIIQMYPLVYMVLQCFYVSLQISTEEMLRYEHARNTQCSWIWTMYIQYYLCDNLLTVSIVSRNDLWKLNLCQMDYSIIQTGINGVTHVTFHYSLIQKQLRITNAFPVYNAMFDWNINNI